MVFRDDGGATEQRSIRPLHVPLLCWHESLHSARTDPLVALSEDAGFIATERPVPVGTPVFLELALGHASNAARAQIDAVVVSGDAPVEMAGFSVRFVDVDAAVLTWIQHHLVAAVSKRASVAPTTVPDVPRWAPEAMPPPTSAPIADEPWSLPPVSAPNAFGHAADPVALDDLEDVTELTELEEIPDTPPHGTPDPAAAAPSRVVFGSVPEAQPPTLPPPAKLEADPDDAWSVASDLELVEELIKEPGLAQLDELIAQPGPGELPAAQQSAGGAFGDTAPRANVAAAERGGQDRQPLDADVEAALGDLPDMTAFVDDDDDGALPGGTPFGGSQGAEPPYPAEDEEPLPGGAPYDPFANTPPAPVHAAKDRSLEVGAMGHGPLEGHDPTEDRAAAHSAFGYGPMEYFGDEDALDGYPGESGALAPPEASSPAEKATLDRAVAMDDAFDASFSPWDDLPPPASSGIEGTEAPAAADGDPFALALPVPGDTVELSGEGEPPPAPPEISLEADLEQPRDLLGSPSYDAFALPSELEALARPALELEPGPDSLADMFDPFADAAPEASSPGAAAPLESDQFVERPLDLDDDDDDLDVDVFDDVTGRTMEPPPPPRPRDDLPGLAEAGIGYSNPFARAAHSQADPVSEEDDEEEADRTTEIMRSPNETPPWGVDHRAVLEEAERRSSVQSPPAPFPVHGGPGTDAVSETPTYGTPQPLPPPAMQFATQPSGPARVAPSRASLPPQAPSLVSSPGYRTPTLEFPQPGPAYSPASHTPTLREFAAVNPPRPPVPPAGTLGPAPAPRSLSIEGFDADDDVVEVSTTSQIVRASEGGIAALVAKDKAARSDLPNQSVTGDRGAVTMGGPGDPFAAPPGPLPTAPNVPAGQPRMWSPGQPQQGAAEGAPIGAYGSAAERMPEPWQVREAPVAALGDVDELPLVTGVSVLLEEDEDLPVAQAKPLEPSARESWVVNVPGRDRQKR